MNQKYNTCKTHLYFITILLVLFTAIPATARVISGTLSRPAGSDTSLAIDVDVSNFPAGAPWNWLSYSLSTIPAGSMSVAFSLEDATNDEIGLYYEIFQIPGELPIAPMGYYHQQGTRPTYESWDPEYHIPAGTVDVSGLNLTLLSAHRVAGTVALPEAAGTDITGLGITAVPAVWDGTTWQCGFSSLVANVSIDSLTPANSPVSFAMQVPDDVATFCISYQLFGNFPEYSSEGYIADDNSTTADATAARHFTGGQDYQDIHLVVIPFTQAEEHTFSGSISLLDGATSSADLNISVSETDVNGNCTVGTENSTTLSLDEISPTQTWSIPVADSTSELCVSYSLFGTQTTYSTVGYLADDDSTTTDATAGRKFATGMDYGGLNLVILPTEDYIFSGNISLPAGYTAAAELTVSVTGLDNNGDCSPFLEIGRTALISFTETHSSETWSITVPGASDNACVSYYVYNEPGVPADYYTTGYLTQGETRSLQQLAVKIARNQSQSNLDLTIIPAITVTGTVTRPAESSNEEWTYFVVGYEIPFDNDWHSSFTYLDFAVGETSKPYTVIVPTDFEEIRIGYKSLYGSMHMGWYGSEGTAYTELEAEVLPVIPLGYHEMDLTLRGSKLLQVSTNSNGGQVVGDNLRIECGDDCSENYWDNTTVQLMAIPATGYLFTGWSGDCTGTASCQVTMDQPRNVSAEFISNPTLLALAGDFNSDDSVDLADFILALQIQAGMTPAVNKNADVNGDGRIGINDAMYSLQQAAGTGQVIELQKNPTLILLTSSGTSSLMLDWLPAGNDNTAMADIVYEIFLSTDPDFIPDAGNLAQTVTGAYQAQLDALAAGTVYYTTIIATFTDGTQSGQSNYLSAKTSTQVPILREVTKTAADLGLGSYTIQENGAGTWDDKLVFATGPDSETPNLGEFLFAKDSAGAMTLHRVEDSAELTPSEIIVTQRPAGLTEIFEQYNLSSSIKMFDLTIEQGSEQFKTYKSSSDVTISTLNLPGRIATANQVNYGTSTSEAKSVEESVNLGIFVDFQPDVDVSVEWKWLTSGFTKAKVSAKGILTMEALAEYNFEAEALWEKEYTLFTRTFGFYYQVGIIPVYQDVTLEIKISASVSGEINFNATALAKLTEEIEVGAIYENDQWRSYFISGQEEELSATLNAGGGVTGTITISPSISTGFYKVAQGTLATELSLETNIWAEANFDLLTLYPKRLLLLRRFDTDFLIRSSLSFNLIGMADDTPLFETAVAGPPGENDPSYYVPIEKVPILSLPTFHSENAEGDVMYESWYALISPEEINPLMHEGRIEITIDDGVNNPLDASSIQWDYLPNDSELASDFILEPDEACTMTSENGTNSTTCGATLYSQGAISLYPPTVWLSESSLLGEVGRQFFQYTPSADWYDIWTKWEDSNGHAYTFTDSTVMIERGESNPDHIVTVTQSQGEDHHPDDGTTCISTSYMISNIKGGLWYSHRCLPDAGSGLSASYEENESSRWSADCNRKYDSGTETYYWNYDWYRTDDHGSVRMESYGECAEQLTEQITTKSDGIITNTNPGNCHNWWDHEDLQGNQVECVYWE